MKQTTKKWLVIPTWRAFAVPDLTTHKLHDTKTLAMEEYNLANHSSRMLKRVIKVTITVEDAK
jgi:hypothetical protein